MRPLRRSTPVRGPVQRAHPLLPEGFALLLRSQSLDVVATATTPDGLLAAVDEHRPHVAILDVRMPPTHTDEGIVAAVEARRRHPEPVVLALSAYVEQTFATDLLAGRASRLGYLLKERVGRGEEFPGGVAAGRRRWRGHRPREPDVLAPMAQGLGNAALPERPAPGQAVIAVVERPDQATAVRFAGIAADHDEGAELEDLVVAPGRRRRGIARHLVRRTVTLARRPVTPSLWVTGNPPSLAFYCAVGLVATGQVPSALGLVRACGSTPARSRRRAAFIWPRDRISPHPSLICGGSKSDVRCGRHGCVSSPAAGAGGRRPWS